MEWKGMKRIILEYYSLPLFVFESFNEGNRKPILLFESLTLCLYRRDLGRKEEKGKEMK